MNAATYLTAIANLTAASLRLRAPNADLESHDVLRGDYADQLSRVGALATTQASQFEAAVVERFALSCTEKAVLWLAITLALEPTARAVVAGDIALGSPQGDLNFAVAQKYVYGGVADASIMQELSSSGTLRRLHLLDRADSKSSDVPERRRTWTVNPRVLMWMQGIESRDPSLKHLYRVWCPVAVENLAVGSAAVDEVRRGYQADDAIVVVSGAMGLGRRSILSAVATELGVSLFEVDASKMGHEASTLLGLAKTIARECILLRRVPLITNVETLVRERDVIALDTFMLELLAEVPGTVLVTCAQNRPPMRWGRPTLVVDIKAPSSEQRAKFWLSQLGQGTQDDAEYLATQYPLAPALIHHTAKTAKARAKGRKMEPDDISAGVRAVLDDKLGDYATRVEVTQTWDDLVLPGDQWEEVQYLIGRISRRRTVYEQWGFAAKVGKGLGTSALFSGPPGTGKTMVAALIAKDLGLELYQVDMAKVVSKFIGETERNLAALFDAAEAGHAILLFDEADSLFGKRTEVKSSNDRYANLETNYMLQRLESFTGICLLTSNHESNIDPAFQRRLSLHLRFELPEEEERAALWRAMLPAAAPVDPNLDVTRLARTFQMSGGYIRNAALRAAFLAADEGSVITTMHLERAARLEYEGMGKIAA